MAKFSVYKHTFKLGEEEYTLLPLTGKDLGLFYNCVKSLPQKEGEELDFDKVDFGDFSELAVKVFKKSYPDVSDDEVSGFVSQNLMVLIEHLVKVHLPVSQR